METERFSLISPCTVSHTHTHTRINTLSDAQQRGNEQDGRSDACLTALSAWEPFYISSPHSAQGVCLLPCGVGLPPPPTNPCSSVSRDCDKLQLGSCPSSVLPQFLCRNAVSKVNPGPICYNTFVFITFSLHSFFSRFSLFSSPLFTSPPLLTIHFVSPHSTPALLYFSASCAPSQFSGGSCN